jgi:energy-coupling factor transporter ATP-binding protein EcfA2
VREVKDAIVQETAKINAIEASNKKIGETIKSTELRQRAWRTKQAGLIASLTKKLHDLEEVDIEAELAKHDQLAKWTTLNDNLTSLVKEQSSLETSLARAEKDVIKAEKNLSALNDDLCYACGQDLHEEKKAEIVAKKDKEFADATTYYQEIANKLEVVNLDIEKVGELNGKPLTFYETAREAYEHQNNVQALIATIKEKQEDEDPYEDQIHQLKNSAIQEINWDAINDFNTYKDHQEFVLKLLTSKDSFIRKKIIDQNLAYLNNRLTYYLAKTGLPHQIKFLNDLSIEITQLGQDLDFDNLSRGERNRLILGMSWAFRDVWESLYNGINLLFIDELNDSGMDTAGVESCLSILKKMGRDRSKNVFLISHKDELVGRVNYVLKVVKENGFTSYANDVDVVVE